MRRCRFQLLRVSSLSHPASVGFGYLVHHLVDAGRHTAAAAAAAAAAVCDQPSRGEHHQQTAAGERHQHGRQETRLMTQHSQETRLMAQHTSQHSKETRLMAQHTQSQETRLLRQHNSVNIVTLAGKPEALSSATSSMKFTLKFTSNNGVSRSA